MNYLSIENIAKSYGEHTLFKEVTFGIDKGQKVAFVAKNGTGKSSLLKMLASLDTPDEGKIIFRKGIKIKFLEQSPVLEENLTIEQIIYQSDILELQTIQNYQKSSENPDAVDKFQDALEKMEELNLWDFDSKVKKILAKLKIENLQQEIKHLSGGQKKRIALAKILIENPDFLILDEPTNHLDLDMIEWLEDYLGKEKLTLFMVTHDRYFLECVCDEIVELDQKQIFKYKGNYSYFLQKKLEREENDAINIGKAKNLMKKELEWIRRQPKARGTKSKARVDAFRGIKEKASKYIDKRAVELEINIPRLGNKILEFHKVQKYYDDLKIVNSFSYIFKRAERIGIVGNNGTGKSTLLKLIMGQEEVNGGKIVVGETIQFGYYSQKGLSFKPEDKVIDVVKKIADYIPLNKGQKISASQMLERFLFSHEKQYQYVSKLSGGEQKRLYLCTVLMQNPNFLILDEPTNDLDIVTLNVLENFLLDFSGCLIVVTHDRYFMDKMVDSIFAFQGDGEVKNFPGNYTEYRGVESQKLKMEKQQKPKKEVSKNKTHYQQSKQFRALEHEIQKLEQRKEVIEKEFLNKGLSMDQLYNLSEELDDLNIKLEYKTKKWFLLSED